MDNVLKDGNYNRVPFDKIRCLIERYRGFERAHERAQCFTEKARSMVN